MSINNKALTQGGKANQNGKAFETTLEEIINSITDNYSSQVPYTNLYGSNRARMDFYIDEYDLNVEAKFQRVSGSVDEKIPFAIANLEAQSSDGLLVLGGDHFYSHRGALILAWAKKKLAESHVSVIMEEDFSDYLNEAKRQKDIDKR